MINELLTEGKENARTARELSALLRVDARTITQQIENERRQGFPICAECRGSAKGYYLASSDEELQQYTDKLKKRAIQIFVTRQALVRTLQQIRDKKEQTI